MTDLASGAATAAVALGAVAAVLVLIGVAIALADLNRNNVVVEPFARAADFLAGPFDIFTFDSRRATIAVNESIAAATYATLGLLTANVVRRIGAAGAIGRLRGNSIPAVLSTLIALAGIFVAADIGLAVLLYDFDANSSNAIVATILTISRTMIGPFRDIYSNDNFKVQVTVNALIAAAVYAAAGLGLARLVRTLGR